MRVGPVEMKWHPGLPIFARESFLRAVGDEWGWLGGFAKSGELRCVLPFTLIRKFPFRMIRFRTETLPQGLPLVNEEEKEFLNGVVRHFKSIGADLVIPASTNSIFQVYPDGADAAPYGSYVIDLGSPEETLWRKIDRITRQNIKTASKQGVVIQPCPERVEPAYRLIHDTFRRSDLPFMSLAFFRRFLSGLGENGLILSADLQGEAQSYVVFGFSEACAYAIYAGNLVHQSAGANKLLYWEAMRHFRGLGIRRFDFMGARLAPEKGSKQEALSHFKKRFGASLRKGYIWKFSLRSWKYRLYGFASRIRSGGDIVDAERHKLKDFDRL